MTREYMYLFTRTDLTTPQQIVQTAHAAAYIGKKYHADTNIVLCACEDEVKLSKIAEYLSKHQIDFKMFYEPDVDAHTAIATQPLVGDVRKPLRRFSLMT
jgi:hypothetical protein